MDQVECDTSGQSRGGVREAKMTSLTLATTQWFIRRGIFKKDCPVLDMKGNPIGRMESTLGVPLEPLESNVTFSVGGVKHRPAERSGESSGRLNAGS